MSDYKFDIGRDVCRQGVASTSKGIGGEMSDRILSTIERLDNVLADFDDILALEDVTLREIARLIAACGEARGALYEVYRKAMPVMRGKEAADGRSIGPDS